MDPQLLEEEVEAEAQEAMVEAVSSGRKAPDLCQSLLRVRHLRAHRSQTMTLPILNRLALQKARNFGPGLCKKGAVLQCLALSSHCDLLKKMIY